MGNIIDMPPSTLLNQESFQECCNRFSILKLKTAIIKGTNVKAVYRTVSSGTQILRLCTLKPHKFLAAQNALFVFLVENSNTLVLISKARDGELLENGKIVTCLNELKDILDKTNEKLSIKHGTNKALQVEKKMVYIENVTAPTTSKSDKLKPEVIDIPVSYKSEFEPPRNAIIQSLCDFVKYANVLERCMLYVLTQHKGRFVDVDGVERATHQREGSISGQSDASSSSTATSLSGAAPKPAARKTQNGKRLVLGQSPHPTPRTTKRYKTRSTTPSSSNSENTQQNDKKKHDTVKTNQNKKPPIIHQDEVPKISDDARVVELKERIRFLEDEVEKHNSNCEQLQAKLDESNEQSKNALSLKDEIAKCNAIYEDNKHALTESEKQNMDMQKHIKELEGELKKYEHKYKDKKEELENSKRLNKDLENNVHELNSLTDILKEKNKIADDKNAFFRKENDACKTQIEDLQHTKEDLVTNNTQLTEELQRAQSKIQRLTDRYSEQVGKLQVELRQVQSDRSEVTDRLASEMNHKISANETALENISIKCRPMNVAEDYNIFVSNSWLDAKQALDKKNVPNETSIEFLCDVLMIAGDCASKQYGNTKQAFTAAFSQNVDDPFLIGNTAGQDKKGKKKKPADLPSEALTIYGDQLRRQADDIDITPLQEKILEQVTDSHPNLKKFFKLIEMYFEESARLSWKMTIQRPPMKFASPDLGKQFRGEKHHPLAWGSKPSEKNAKIQFYQYPSLLHNETVMVKGKVFVA